MTTKLSRQFLNLLLLLKFPGKILHLNRIEQPTRADRCRRFAARDFFLPLSAGLRPQLYAYVASRLGNAKKQNSLVGYLDNQLALSERTVAYVPRSRVGLPIYFVRNVLLCIRA